MVSSFTQLLGSEYKDKLDNNAQEYINFAVEGSKRMQNLIGDLLEYSRIGRREKPFEKVDCNMALKAAITNLTHVIKESNAEVTYDSLPTVSGETFRLIQLFQNLIGNAIKYRSDVSPKVHISTEQKDNEWTFLVKDNGIGIDPKHAEKIFVIFQRLHGREKYSGTGIGLALCKKIVEQQKGKIWVNSKVGEGSTFYFALPTN
jgi:light-regulated signal transduction histidine kinase (bacteriophytochrome)